MPTKEAKTRTRDFGQSKKISDFEPLNFTLNGDTFNCRPAIQGGELLHFVAEADSDDGAKSAQALIGFFDKALFPEDNERFQAMLAAEDIIIDLEMLGDIAAWLIEEYTTRPTSEPAS